MGKTLTFSTRGGLMPRAKKKKTAKKKVTRKKVAKKKVVKKVRCAGKTKDGKRCKRMATPPSKCCHLHKKKRSDRIIFEVSGGQSLGLSSILLNGLFQG